MKAGMQGLPRRHTPTIVQSLLSFTGTILGLCIISAAVYYGVGWTKDVFGAAATPIVVSALVIAYITLISVSARNANEGTLDVNAELTEVPDPSPTIKSGLHYLLPIVVLVWCLTVERFSPGLSAFWATVFMIFIIITQRPLISFISKQGNIVEEATAGFVDLLESLVSGARNMIGISVATAAAGTVVGAVTLTGIGLVMTDFVEFISGGNIILMLLFTAVISLILGMGLPTTANYIVVSTLMAPVIVTLGAQSGLIIPLIAVHLFVFYFGILADDTPPVGLAAFAAAAIAKSDPIRTGIQGFTYDIRTAILPFMFIFNTQLLLIGIDTWWHLLLTVLSSIVAMLIFLLRHKGGGLPRINGGKPCYYCYLPLLSSVRVIGGIKYTHPKNSIRVQTSNKLRKVCRLDKISNSWWQAKILRAISLVRQCAYLLMKKQSLPSIALALWGWF